MGETLKDGAGGGHVAVADDASFAEVAERASATVPVIVDFWGSACGPCVGVSRMLEALAAELAGAVKIVKVDVETAVETAARFGARSLPTLLFMRHGKVVHTMVGATSKERVKAEIAKRF